SLDDLAENACHHCQSDTEVRIKLDVKADICGATTPAGKSHGLRVVPSALKLNDNLLCTARAMKNKETAPIRNDMKAANMVESTSWLSALFTAVCIDGSMPVNNPRKTHALECRLPTASFLLAFI